MGGVHLTVGEETAASTRRMSYQVFLDISIHVDMNATVLLSSRLVKALQKLAKLLQISGQSQPLHM